MKTIIFSFATLLITYSSMSIANQQIAQKSGCLTCHTIDKPTFAPSFSDIAEKYSGNKAVFEHLVDSIKYGSYGVWGKVGMQGYGSNISDENARAILSWILNKGWRENPTSSNPQVSRTETNSYSSSSSNNVGEAVKFISDLTTTIQAQNNNGLQPINPQSVEPPVNHCVKLAPPKSNSSPLFNVNIQNSCNFPILVALCIVNGECRPTDESIPARMVPARSEIEAPTSRQSSNIVIFACRKLQDNGAIGMDKYFVKWNGRNFTGSCPKPN